MDWAEHFPAYMLADVTTQNNVRPLVKRVEVADIGCGFGGLLIALSSVLPDALILGQLRSKSPPLDGANESVVGMELRSQVLDYVINRITALRSQHLSMFPHEPGKYQNISAVRTNSMKFLPNYFERAQLSKIFLCFPDPHFKQRKHKARIVSAQLNSEYAFILKPGGKLYTVTDVEELHLWMVNHFEGEESGDVAGLWDRVTQAELESDVCANLMTETEEGKKVTRNGGQKYVGVWRRREDPD